MCEVCKERERLESTVRALHANADKMYASKFIDKRTGQARLVLCLPMPQKEDGFVEIMPVAVFMMEADFSQVIPEHAFDQEIPYTVVEADVKLDLTPADAPAAKETDGSGYTRQSITFGKAPFEPDSLETLKAALARLMQGPPKRKRKKDK